MPRRALYMMKEPCIPCEQSDSFVKRFSNVHSFGLVFKIRKLYEYNFDGLHSSITPKTILPSHPHIRTSTHTYVRTYIHIFLSAKWAGAPPPQPHPPPSPPSNSPPPPSPPPPPVLTFTYVRTYRYPWKRICSYVCIHKKKY